MTRHHVGASSDSSGLLDAATVIEYLDGRELIDAGSATAEALGGGVSNVVLAVTDRHRRLVVKQALPRLRVADEWTAPAERALTEADALELAATLTPSAVPAVVDRDDDRNVLVLTHAPDGWRDWKRLLLSGVVDDQVAWRLGEVLATWHSSTVDVARLPSRVRQASGAFEQLRIDPFYRTVANRAPEVADVVLAMADTMRTRRTCLVHGDFSPKNVLVNSDGRTLWVIDFEVTHVGDPAFDLAFLLCHLLLKSIHRPQDAAAYDRCAVAFAESYEQHLGSGPMPDWPYILRHTGCLLMARVRGKSPAEYLDAGQGEAAWRLGVALVTAQMESIRDAATRRDEVVR